jgi:hypothetical protein
MAVIQRPTKQGNATTYQGKVAAGYTTILASEVDADLDLMYSAWNQGVDTTNIKDGSITGSKLAAGAVGSREIADGSIQTVDIGAGQVTTPIIADGAVTPGKMAGGGVMGGDLTGSYPNPSLSTIQSGQVAFGHGGRAAAITGWMEVSINEAGVPGANASQPSWILRFDALNDAFVVLRAPPGPGAYVNVATIDHLGQLYATLVAGSVGRTQLAPNAIYGQSASSACPAGYSVSSPIGSWFTYMTLTSITTRGGNVALLAQHNLSGSGPAGGGTIAQRWMRGATVVQERALLINSTAYVPLPGLQVYDTPAAGTYTYAMQLFLGTGCAIVAPAGSTQGFLQASEIG